MRKWIYAVQLGRVNGVFHTWAEAEQSVKGFKGAKHRKFPASEWETAQRWAGQPAQPSAPACTPSTRPPSPQPEEGARKKPKASLTSAASSSHIYAVRTGRQTGLFSSWREVEPLIRSFPGASYRKFPSSQRQLAQSFIARSAATAAVQTREVSPMASATIKKGGAPPAQPKGEGMVVLPDDQTPCGEAGVQVQGKSERYPSPERSVLQDLIADEPPAMSEGKVNVWCDGSSLSNGKAGARAGWGVYFPSLSPYVGLTEAKRLPGPLQTNNRGELVAIGRVCSLLPLHVRVRIYTDSQYAIKALTVWADKWERNEWKTADGKDVQNAELIRWIRGLMRQRRPELVYVKGHAGDAGNTAADRLARLGASLPEEPIEGLPSLL